MKTHTRLFTVSAVLLALAGWFLTGSGSGKAADDKDPREGVLKLADMIEKKDGGVKKQAEAIAKDADIEDVMHLMALRSKKGVGIGGKPGAIAPDGIEAKIGALGKKALPAKDAAAQAKDLERAAYIAAAIAQVAQSKLPDKNAKQWQGFAEDMHKGALDLAKAAKAKNADDIKAAATKLEGACNACHEKFR